MFEVTMYIPTNGNEDNNGDRAEFSADHHSAFEAVAFEMFGGYTLLPQLNKGSYLNRAGQRDVETTRSYVIGISSLEQGSKIAELARFACAHYAQECIGVSYLGQFEMLS